MRKEKNVTINGIDFEVVTGKKASENIINDIDSTYLTDIFSIYGRPSQTKIEIYYEWEKWFDEIGVSGYFGCMRGGSSTFSIGAKYEDETGRRVYLYITKDHNRVVYA